DKTFHWNKVFYTSKGVIPYDNDWIGFIHHTYSYYNNHYNCDVIFKDSQFIESLNKCKCLIVMSKYLKNQIQQSLDQLIESKTLIKAPVVEVLYHPTEE